jgi:hypothetical protein
MPFALVFNAKKCHVMRLKRSRQNIVSINNYNIDGSTLEEVEHHPYLGVELGNDLNWNHHIDQTTTKANGLRQFDIGGKGPIQMIRIQGLGVRVLCTLSP